jgi:hypothetical protein
MGFGLIYFTNASRGSCSNRSVEWSKKCWILAAQIVRQHLIPVLNRIIAYKLELKQRSRD